MTSIKRAGRITTFGFAVGAGLLIVSGAGAAVAAAAPADSSHASASSSSASGGSSPSARSARTAAVGTAKPKPARSASARSDYAPVVHLRTVKRTAVTSAAAVSVKTDDIAAVPASSATLAPAKRVAALPTPADFQQSVVAGLDAARRRLDDLRQKVQTLIANQIYGFQDNLVTLRIDLERIFNPNKQIIYGNPANSRYWAFQGAQTATLMSAAMVISALTGQTVTAQSIVDEAMNTDSVARPGRPMYLGPGSGDWAWPTDAVQLLENHGIKVTTVFFTKSQQQRALDTIETALTQGKSVVVSITGNVVTVGDESQGVWTVEHQAVLLGINITKNVVYLNDGANPQGQSLTMSIEDFLDAWQTSRYRDRRIDPGHSTSRSFAGAREHRRMTMACAVDWASRGTAPRLSLTFDGVADTSTPSVSMNLTTGDAGGGRRDFH